jgi:hypothetical protein
VLATLPIAIITLLGFIKDTSFIKLEFITKNRHCNEERLFFYALLDIR